MTLTTSKNTTVHAAQLHAASRRAITRAAQDLWPDKRVNLGPQSPSVTSYVCQVTVDGEELMAKYSWLGLSLVSVLRGAGGTWAHVQEAQAKYVRSADLVTAREARQLASLRELGRPAVCETVGIHEGVLFTRTVPGVALADVLAARPEDTGPFLDMTLRALGELHGPAGAQRMRELAQIGERSVARVFRRKFNRSSTTAYLGALIQDHGLLEDERQEVIELVQIAVRLLLPMSGRISRRRVTAVFGDLKPEHVFLDGPVLTFIDPALQWAPGPQPDVAKLTGRTLLLALSHPQQQAGQQIVQGVASTLSRHLARLPATGRAAYLREVLVLWAMDTLSILMTCLSAPQGLPLAPHQKALVAQARAIARLVDRVGALLCGSAAGLRLLEAVLSEVEHTVGSAR